MNSAKSIYIVKLTIENKMWFLCFSGPYVMLWLSVAKFLFFFFFFYVKVGIYISSTCVEKESGFHAQLILTLFKIYIKIFKCLDAFRFTRIIFIKKKKKRSENMVLQNTHFCRYISYLFHSHRYEDPLGVICGTECCGNEWRRKMCDKSVERKRYVEFEKVFGQFLKKKYACNIL